MTRPEAAGARTLLGAARTRFGALSRPRRIAALASALWIVLVAAYAIGFLGGASQARGTVALDALFFLVTLVLPLILIWIAAGLAEELARQREAIAALTGLAAPLTDALRETAARLEQASPSGDAATGPALARILSGQERIAAALSALDASSAPAPRPAQAPDQTPAAATAPTPRRARPQSRPAPKAAPDPARQPDLPLLAEPEPAEPLDWEDLIRALDFPRDADDRDGFRALRLALRQHGLAQMLQAAEDVLTLLAQEDVYMDDLGAAPLAPGLWRRFLGGARGADLAGMGGVADDAALQTAKRMMRQDPIFRDTALFFQRRFDAALGGVADGSSDDEIAQIADTRSGRAFQLLAGASGSLD